MHQQTVSPAILAAALSACTQQPELLNSERIKKQFGNYHIVVLGQDAGVRRSSLDSEQDGVETCRTYAVVQFVDANIAEIEEPHQGVLAGQSIGTTFKESGWHIRKDILYIGELSMTDSQHQIGQLMRLNHEVDLAVHAYRMTLEKSDISIEYATIVEIHHPDYMTEAALLELFAVDQRQQISPPDLAVMLSMVLTPLVSAASCCVDDISVPKVP
jgi:hypothetical protein